MGSFSRGFAQTFRPTQAIQMGLRERDRRQDRETQQKKNEILDLQKQSLEQEAEYNRFSNQLDQSLREFIGSGGQNTKPLEDTISNVYPDDSRIRLQRNPDDDTYSLHIKRGDGEQTLEGLSMDQVGQMAAGMADPMQYLKERAKAKQMDPAVVGNTIVDKKTGNVIYEVPQQRDPMKVSPGERVVSPQGELIYEAPPAQAGVQDQPAILQETEAIFQRLPSRQGEDENQRWLRAHEMAASRSSTDPREAISSFYQGLLKQMVPQGAFPDDVKQSEQTARELTERFAQRYYPQFSQVDRSQGSGQWPWSSTRTESRGLNRRQPQGQSLPGRRTQSQRRTPPPNTTRQQGQSSSRQATRQLIPQGMRQQDIQQQQAPRRQQSQTSQSPGTTGQRQPPAAQGNGQQQVYQPQNRQEFDALPSGALYVDPGDGKLYRKP